MDDKWCNAIVTNYVMSQPCVNLTHVCEVHIQQLEKIVRWPESDPYNNRRLLFLVVTDMMLHPTIYHK